MAARIQTNAAWAKQYDAAFPDDVGFVKAMNFLKKSVEAYYDSKINTQRTQKFRSKANQKI